MVTHETLYPGIQEEISVLLWIFVRLYPTESMTCDSFARKEAQKTRDLNSRYFTSRDGIA